MSASSLASLCAEAVADLTAGGCPEGVTAAEVATWITDGGGTATPAEAEAALERLSLRTGLLAAGHARQRADRLWLVSRQPPRRKLGARV